MTDFGEEDNAIYKYLDFGDGIKSVTIRYKTSQEVSLKIAANKPWFNELANIKLNAGDKKDVWQVATFPVLSKVNGIHALWLTLVAKEGNGFELDWFMFNR
ncbi:MAG: hypothetical protein HC896_12715 [Bacteroidales bacterium]|nr:hypothetical protein [Bacteroidales bacterium]